MSLPRIPYLQNAVKGYRDITGQWYIPSGVCIDAESYNQWMRDQGVKMPIGVRALSIDDVRIEFETEEQETVFLLRWS